jgi:redox-sensitive bicupin YhaK (pirin superfamily)
MITCSLILFQADPFILLVHHRHSFFKFDPLRALFRVLMPEGFPAHPHRGFETGTANVAAAI